MTPQESNESNITRREALRCLLAGAALVAGVSTGLTACRKVMPDDDRAGGRSGHPTAAQPKIACIGCGLCMPCPYGVDIPGNFQVYNDAVALNELPDPRQAGRKDYRRLRHKFLNDYEHRLNHLERADHCIACRRCEHTCPQQLDIPQLMQQIASLTEGLRQTR